MKRTHFLLLLLILIMQMILRVPFLNEPLEADEGVYAYLGQRVLAGEVPYRDYFDHKPPAVYYIYASIFKVFGQSVFSLRSATALLGLLATFLVYLCGRGLLSSQAGLISAFFYAVFSGGPLVDGSGSNTEVFMVLFLLIALYSFIVKKAGTAPLPLFLCGVFSGLAFMTKQVAIVNFLVFCGLAVKDSPKRSIKNIMLLLSGFAAAPLAFTAYFWIKAGLFDFIDKAFLFNLGYVQPAFDSFFLYRSLYIMLYENSLIWFLGSIGAVYILIKKQHAERRVLVFWFIASALGVFMGGYCFGHYYIQALPALCLLSAYAVQAWRQSKLWLWAKAGLAFWALVLLVPALGFQFPFYFKYSPDEISIYKYQHVNNVLAKRVADKLNRAGLLKDRRIAVRFFPQIYFYARATYPEKYFYGFPDRGVSEYRKDGKVLFSRVFQPKIRERYLYGERADYIRALDNPSNELAVFIVQDADLAGTRKDMAKKGYRFRADLSEAYCRVFQRVRPPR